MIILVLAVVLGLIAFAILRAVAVPVIFLLLAVFLYEKGTGSWTTPETTTQVTSIATSTPLMYPLPSSEAAVCNALERASAQFDPLETQWNTVSNLKEANELKKQLLVDKSKIPVNELFNVRNNEILIAVNQNNLHIANWIAKITKVDLDEGLYGDERKRFITLHGEIPCRLLATLSTEGIEATPNITTIVNSISVGDYVSISGNLVKHDEAQQSLADSIEWGGPLWGPFGGLWSSAIRKPSFMVKITDVRPAH